MNPAKILVVDGNALCYSAFYSTGQLSHKNQDTGVIYGFFNQIQHACQTQQVAHIAFCWDSRQSRRKLIFPAYKSNRGKSDPQILRCLKQITLLREELIPRLGFKNSFHKTGFEADDLIARVCVTSQSGQERIIMSNDQDLYQLLSAGTTIYKPSKRRLYTLHDFMRDYGIPPYFWAEVKAIAGCSSDAIPGIPGIGEKRALDFIKHPPGPYKRHPKIELGEGSRIRERNLKLVKLPFEGTPPLELDWSELPSFAEWILLCEELGFTSFLNRPSVWEHIYAGIPPKNETLTKIRIAKKRGSFLCKQRSSRKLKVRHIASHGHQSRLVFLC